MIRWGRRITPPTLALCLTLAASLSAGATRAVAQQGAPQTAAASGALAEALRLNDEAAKLFDAGRYVEAVRLAERALSLREKALGPDHPDVAVTLNLLGKLRREQADFVQAETLLKRALAIREKTPGPNHPVTAETLNDLADLYGGKADLAQAEPLLMRAVLIYTKVRGPGDPDPDAATPLNNLGMIYVVRGDIARGEVLCVNALNARMKMLGPDHRHTAESFDTIGTLFLVRGDLVNAEQYLQRALTVREKVLGPDHPDVADSLLNLSNLYSAKNDLARAESLAERARSIREKALGVEHPEYASSLIYLGKIYGAKGDTARAEQNILRAISIMEKALGPDHLLVADALQALALITVSTDQAEQLARRVLAIREKAFGPDHMLVADSLAYLGSISLSKGDFMQAKLQYWRSASIRVKTFGAAHPTVAESFLSIANLLSIEGDTMNAGPMCGQAALIYQAVFGPDHPNVAMALEKGGEILREKGDYVVSEQLLQRALAIREKAFGPDHLLVAASLNNLALTTFWKGDMAGAEPLFQRALSILEKSPEKTQPAIIKTLNNLAVLYNEKGDLPRAEATFRRAEAMVDKSSTPGRQSGSELLNNRAILYMKMGDYAQAEPLFAQSLLTTEKLFGGDHPNVAVLLVNMAGLYMGKGDYARAEEFLSRGEDVRERNLSLVFASGSERQKFSYLLTLSNETYQAISLHTRMEPSDRKALRLSLTTILRRKGRALDTTTDQIATLRRRAASGEFKLLGANEIGMLDQLSATQSQLSSLILGGQRDLPTEQYMASLGMLGTRAEQLQDAISRLGAEFKQQPVTIEQVQQSLPPRAALVEFFTYRPYEPKGKRAADSFGPGRYVVYVLRKEGDPMWVDIGDASSVDADLTRLLIALRCPQTGEDIAGCPSVAEVKRLSRVVDERLMHPVRKLLGDTRHIFISPDGALNLLPFAALVDDSGKYLVESYSLTYLTSGRDLLRLKSSVESKEPPLVLANPAFGKNGQPPAATPTPAVASVVAPTVGPPAAPTTLQPITPLPPITPSILPPLATIASAPSTPAAATPRRSADFMTVNFGPLPGSANEARTLAGLLPGARVLMQEQATEAALKQAHSPSVLHIATHGFFLPDQPSSPADSTLRLNLAGEGVGTRLLIRSENPLLRSGLALAGANLPAPQGGGEDGILTALEAASLDLSGTKLVVLSACDTGVGAAIYGEGVYGLRRALVLAGSESQVMSLWQVSDDATRDLMIGYYQRLLAGEGRTEALRQVQLEMLRSGGRDEARQSPRPKTVGAAKADYSHPYYWAAFIQSGDWKSLNPRPSPTNVTK